MSGGKDYFYLLIQNEEMRTINLEIKWKKCLGNNNKKCSSILTLPSINEPINDCIGKPIFYAIKIDSTGEIEKKWGKNGRLVLQDLTTRRRIELSFRYSKNYKNLALYVGLFGLARKADSAFTKDNIKLLNEKEIV